MKVMKKLVSVLLVGAMTLSIAACSKSEKVKKYSADEYQKIVANALNIAKDDVKVDDVKQPQFSGVNIKTGGKTDVAFDVIICENSDFPRAQFEHDYEIASKVVESDSFKQQFNGKYNISYEDDVGYIVVEGRPCGMHVFGDANEVTENFYGGIYYIDNILVRVSTRPHEANPDDVIKVIEALGYPKADNN